MTDIAVEINQKVIPALKIFYQGVFQSQSRWKETQLGEKRALPTPIGYALLNGTYTCEVYADNDYIERDLIRKDKSLRWRLFHYQTGVYDEESGKCKRLFFIIVLPSEKFFIESVKFLDNNKVRKEYYSYSNRKNKA